MLLSLSGDRRNPGHARSVSDNTHPRSGDLDVAERRRPVGCLSEAIKARDSSDTTRSVSPLTLAPDAIHIDTTTMPVHDVVHRVLEIVRSKGMR